MLDLEEIKSKIQEFERRQEEIDGYYADLAEDFNILKEDNENFRTNNADVLTNGSQNPVKIQREKRERAFLLLDERSKELEQLSDEINELEETLNKEIDEFANGIIEEIQEEKNRINTEVQEPDVSINRLNAEKQQLESDRKRYKELIALAESRENFRPDDSIYKNLKRMKKNTDTKIAQIDHELEELDPDRLSDLWDKLDGYEKNIKNLEGSSKDKIDILCNTFDVKTQEQLRQEAEAEEAEHKAEAEEAEHKAGKEAEVHTEEPSISDIDKGLREQAKREAAKDKASSTQSEPSKKRQDLGRKYVGSAETTKAEPKISNVEKLAQDIKSTLKGKTYNIRIGNKGKIQYDGKSYVISARLIKQGAKLNSLLHEDRFLKSNKLIEKIKEQYPEDIIKLLQKSIECNVPIDFTIIESLKEFSPELENSKKEALIKSYIINASKAHYDYCIAENDGETAKKLEQFKNVKSIKNMNIVYDMKNLAKTDVLKALFSLNRDEELLDDEQKIDIVELANKSARYGIAKTEGKFKQPFLTRVVGFIQRKFNSPEQKYFPAPEKIETTIDYSNKKTIEKKVDEIQKAYYDIAMEYDTLRDESKDEDGKVNYSNLSKSVAQKAKEFKKGIWVSAENRKKETELINLAISQKKQEKNKDHTDDRI